MRLWWKTYRPLLISKKYPEEFWLALTLEEFSAKIKTIINFDETTKEARFIELQMSYEFAWVKAKKPTLFITNGVTSFVNNTKGNHVANLFTLYLPFSIAWYPKDCFYNMPLFPILVFPRTKSIDLLWHNTVLNAYGGTTIPLNQTIAEITQKRSPLAIYYMQLVFGLLSYLQTYPSANVPGVPKNIKICCIKQCKGNAASTVVLLNELKNRNSGYWIVENTKLTFKD